MNPSCFYLSGTLHLRGQMCRTTEIEGMAHLSLFTSVRLGTVSELINKN